MSAQLDDREARILLRKVKTFGGDAQVMRNVADRMQQLTYDGFRHQAAPDGTPWAPLAPVTLAARQRRGNHSIQPLIDTGALYSSIDSTSTATEAVVTIGVDLPDARAWWNQFGHGKAPARPMLPLDDSVDSEWFARVIQPISDALEALAA